MSRQRHSGISDQRKASMHRLADAQALFEKRRWRGAMYMAGYAVECRLKYKLMKKWDCYTLEELEKRLLGKGMFASPFTHDLGRLLGLLDNSERMRNASAVWASFTVVNKWQPSWRYSPDVASSDQAAAMLSDVAQVVAWVENNC